MRPILTEADGVTDFVDLVEQHFVRTHRRVKGTTNRVIVDWRATPRGADLKPAIVIKESKNGKLVRVARGVDARYMFQSNPFSGRYRCQGEGGRRACAYPDRLGQDRWHLGGLPRVAELFEARRRRTM